jgi:Protein of unknown function (DUF1566)
MFCKPRVRPMWDITEAQWINHSPNSRFVIYHHGTSGGVSEDVVLDKETRLVWQRVPDTAKKTWDAAIVSSYATTVAGRKGWRLPAIEELLSLVDPTQNNPTLPVGHPFMNIQMDYFYWSSTLGMSSLPTYAWGYNFGNADTSNVIKSASAYAWLVRGGYGHDYPY